MASLFFSSYYFQRARFSNKVVNAVFGPHTAPNAKNVGREPLRAELDVIPRTSPDITRVGQQIVHLIGLARIEVELRQRQIDPRRLSAGGGQVNHNDDKIQK